ncbi:MAG: response regulator transcription factor [Rhodospirillales bacterium]
MTDLTPRRNGSIPTVLYSIASPDQSPKAPSRDQLIDLLRTFVDDRDCMEAFSEALARRSENKIRLTPRQREVLHLLVNGRSNKEIARALALSEPTVKIHLAAVMQALNARNRTHAAVKGAMMGIGLDPIDAVTH